jgi:HEAT repeat protein
LWVAAGADLGQALGLDPARSGELVAVLAPGDAGWADAASEQLPWLGAAVVDPARSAWPWVEGDPSPALAGALAAWEIAAHYDLPFTAAATPLPPGLDVRLGTWDPAWMSDPDPRRRAEAARAAPARGMRADTLVTDSSTAVRLAVAETTTDADVARALAADPEPLVRTRAADRLDDVETLATLLEDPSSVVRVVAAHRLATLATIRPGAVGPPLQSAARSPDAYVRWKAAWGLGKIAGSADALVPLLDDPDIDVRREAARGLGRLGSAEALAPLRRALRDPNSFVRRWAADALGQLRDPAARDDLRAALADPTALVAQAAGRALGALGEPTAPVPFHPPGRPADDAALDALLASPDATVRKDASKFLAGRDDAAARLVRLAGDPDSEVRKSAVEAMGWSVETAGAAGMYLADPDPDVRVTALDAARRASVGDADRIAACLQDPDAEVRLRAAEALAALGASDRLATRVTDPDERIRAAAVGANPERLRPDEPSALVRRAAGRPSADPIDAPMDASLGRWAAGVIAREDDLLHLRFSWNDEADRPAAHRALRPPVYRAYGHPDRG